jgi:hypothetical protein
MFQFIVANLQSLLQTQPFVYTDSMSNENRPLSRNKLRSIVAEGELQVVSELQLFKAVETWVKAVVGQKLASKKIREEVKYLLPCLRILSLEKQELIEYLNVSIIYSDEEKKNIIETHENEVNRKKTFILYFYYNCNINCIYIDL